MAVRLHPCTIRCAAACGELRILFRLPKSASGNWLENRMEDASRVKARAEKKHVL